MSRQVLGKRPRSSSRLSSPPSSRPQTPAYKTRRITRELPSPDPTPNPKRVKGSSIEVDRDDDSNKENIPPIAALGPLTPARVSANSFSPNSTSDMVNLANTLTPRAQRASRRASIQTSRHTPGDLNVHIYVKTYLNFIPVSRHRSFARPHADASSSVADSLVSERTGQIGSPLNTPSRDFSRLSFTTPPPTPELISLPPLVKDASEKPASLYARARALLRPQGYEIEPLIGRERERSHILDFLTPFVSGQSSLDNVASLYVSGAPGTGKTALINQILSSPPFVNDQKASRSSVHVINVNCMALGAKDGLLGVWECCLNKLGLPKETKRGSPTKVDWSQRFNKLFRDRKWFEMILNWCHIYSQVCSSILVLDEIDYLATSTSTSPSSSASQLFAIAAAPQTRDCLRVIGISNTHTLTHAKPSSHTRTIHFEPYTGAQMKAILGARLAGLSNSHTTVKLFSPATLALLTMKIAGQTGDIRTVFSVARRSLDLAVTGSPSSADVTVTPAHVLAAFKASHASIGSSSGPSGAETVTRVRNLGLHARFALAALLLATRRIISGLSLSSSSSSVLNTFKEKSNYQSVPGGDGAPPAIDVTALHGFYTTILSRGAAAAFCGLGRTEFTDLVGLLEGNSLVELSQGRGFGSKTKGSGKNLQVVSIASGIRIEELVRGLVGSPANENMDDAAVDVKEEEVRHIWEKETARIGREIKAKFGNTGIKNAGFEGAEED